MRREALNYSAPLCKRGTEDEYGSLTPMLNNGHIEKVRAIVTEECCEKVDAETSFVALGIDSLEFLCIVNRVRNEVGPVDDVMISQIRTVKDLAAAAAIGARR